MLVVGPTDWVLGGQLQLPAGAGGRHGAVHQRQDPGVVGQHHQQLALWHRIRQPGRRRAGLNGEAGCCYTLCAAMSWCTEAAYA